MKVQKLLLNLILVSVFLVFGTSCTIIRPNHQHPSRTVIIKTNGNGKIPPGQMKKATGAKNAKQYAPGQVKKNKKNK
jgi:hypothetical protein